MISRCKISIPRYSAGVLFVCGGSTATYEANESKDMLSVQFATLPIRYKGSNLRLCTRTWDSCTGLVARVFAGGGGYKRISSPTTPPHQLANFDLSELITSRGVLCTSKVHKI